jgi:hypothetical protein
MRGRRAGLLAFVLLAGLGNAPHPSAYCSGKAAGDRCKKGGYGCSSDGICTLQTNCTDFPETSVNECLVCD